MNEDTNFELDNSSYQSDQDYDGINSGGYEFEGSNDNNPGQSFERRLKLENAATRIAMLNRKLTKNPLDENSDSDPQKGGRSGGGQRTK